MSFLVVLKPLLDFFHNKLSQLGTDPSTNRQSDKLLEMLFATKNLHYDSFVKLLIYASPGVPVKRFDVDTD